MYKSKLNLIIFLFAISVGLILLTVFNMGNYHLGVLAQSNSGQTNQDISAYTAQDIIDEALDSDSVEERVRVQSKKSRYDRFDARRGSKVSKDLTQLPPNTGIAIRNETPPPGPLPINPDTLVVIGTINRMQPYLTESKTLIFTEFTLKVENVLKSNSNLNLISPNSLINFDSDGGAIRLRNGKVIRYEAGNGVRFPRKERRYLLFLDPVNSGQDLSLTNGYELRDGKVFALRETLTYKPGAGRISKKSPFTGMDESQFIQQVIQTIRNPNGML